MEKSEFEANGKDVMISKKKILIPFNILSDANEDCQIYIGMVFRYFKCKETSKKWELSNERKESSEKFELFWCDFEFDLSKIGSYVLKLHKSDKHRSIVPSNNEWVKIEENDIFYRQMFDLNSFSSYLKSEEYFCFFNLNANNILSSSSIKQNNILCRQTLSEITQKLIPNYNSTNLYSSQVIYHFKYSQRSTTMNNFICPFCLINCYHFEALTIHLKANHDRFAFNFSSDPLKIKVSFNDHFESSCESDRLMNSFYGLTKQRMPSRRKSTNFMLLSNEKLNYFLSLNEKMGNSCDLTELPSLFQENDYRRVYFHSQTCAPILPCEIDDDSEDEDFSDWLKQRTISVFESSYLTTYLLSSTFFSR